MGKKRVPFHLSISYTSRSLPSLHWLVSEDVYGASGTHLELVRHHVPEALVVDNTEKDVCLELSPVYARVHSLVAKVVVASCRKEQERTPHVH